MNDKLVIIESCKKCEAGEFTVTEQELKEAEGWIECEYCGAKLLPKIEQEGPTEAELLLAKNRLDTLDRISNLCKWELYESQLDADARAAREHWNAIMKIQTEFESKYF